MVFLRDTESVKLASSQFFSELLNTFEQRKQDRNAQSKSKTKFIGLFAHDITVKTMLRALETVSFDCLF